MCPILTRIQESCFIFLPPSFFNPNWNLTKKVAAQTFLMLPQVQYYWHTAENKFFLSSAIHKVTLELQMAKYTERRKLAQEMPLCLALTSSGRWITFLCKQSWLKHLASLLTVKTGKREKATSEREVKKLWLLTQALPYSAFCFPELPLPAFSLKGRRHLFNSSSRAVEKVFLAAVWRKGDGGGLLHPPPL